MDDLINIQAAIEYFKRIIDATNTDGRYNLGFIDGLEFCINHLSSAQPERKKGKWIIADMYNSQVWHCNCSECGKDPQYFISGTEDWWINKLPNFCPNCGAKMEEEE